jgi:hypothetical protein
VPLESRQAHAAFEALRLMLAQEGDLFGYSEDPRNVVNEVVKRAYAVHCELTTQWVKDKASDGELLSLDIRARRDAFWSAISARPDYFEGWTSKELVGFFRASEFRMVAEIAAAVSR